MRTALLGLAAATIVGASVAVISGQHAPAVHSGQHPSSSHASMLHACESPEHVSKMGEKLDLTADQRATIERITTEACAAMTKYHEQILASLTPEQREKLKLMHGHGEGAESESVLHTLFKKLHGR